jgi:hypothetical protein
MNLDVSFKMHPKQLHEKFFGEPDNNKLINKIQMHTGASDALQPRRKSKV